MVSLFEVNLLARNFNCATGVNGCLVYVNMAFDLLIRWQFNYLDG